MVVDVVLGGGEVVLLKLDVGESVRDLLHGKNDKVN